MVKFRKIISFIICLTIIAVNITLKGNAADNNSTREIVYVDGIAFEYYISDLGETIIKSLDDNGKTYLKLDSNGNAEAEVFNKENYEQYNLDIQDLSEENLYIEVKKDNELVEVFDKVDDILSDEYTGQAAITMGTGIAIGTLVTVLLQVTATVVIGGLTYYAVSTVIDKIKNNKNNKNAYYKASIQNYTTYIAFYSGKITKNQAASRIKSKQNVYTYTKDLAKQAVVASGLGCITSPEIHYRKGKFSFYHYHTLRRNGAHSLYGMPYTKG